MENTLVFQWGSAGAHVQPPSTIHCYDVTMLADICKAIVARRLPAVSGREIETDPLPDAARFRDEALFAMLRGILLELRRIQ